MQIAWQALSLFLTNWKAGKTKVIKCDNQGVGVLGSDH